MHGERRDLDASGQHVVTLVEYESRKIGAILHDPELLEMSEFLDAFVPSMRIAMERDRLHRDLVEKLAQLKASRLRIVETAEQERRRLERNLHDGAQQRLVVVLLALHGLERRLRDDAELEPVVRGAREELEGAVADLRELARGLHPPLLAQQGLEAAVRAGAARSSLPVELEIVLEPPLPAAVEAAAYYVCAEAVTNAVKHARCTKVWLSIVQENQVPTSRYATTESQAPTSTTRSTQRASKGSETASRRWTAPSSSKALPVRARASLPPPPCSARR